MPTLFTGAGANFARPMQSLARWAARDVTTGRLDCMKGRGIVSPPSDLENMRRCSAHFTNESLLDRHESIRAAASRGFRVLLLPLVLKELCCCCRVVVLWCCHVVVLSLRGDEGWPLCATVRKLIPPKSTHNRTWFQTALTCTRQTKPAFVNVNNLLLLMTRSMTWMAVASSRS